MTKPAATFGFQDVDPSTKAGLVRGIGLASFIEITNPGAAFYGVGRPLAYERVGAEARPDLVLVVGDVNSTLACALAYAARDAVRDVLPADWQHPDSPNTSLVPERSLRQM